MPTRKKSDSLLHIVMPVFNEGDNFPNQYKLIKKNIKTPYKLLVVYDFDEDTTVPVVKKFQKTDKNVVLVKNKLGRGVLYAILSGFNKVPSGALLVMMGDLCDDLSQVDAMHAEYKKGATVVCASRFMKGGRQVGGPFIKRTLSRIAGVSLYYIRRVPTHDVTNNFRLYDKKFIDTITIESKGGFEIAMEITIKAFMHRKKIVEMPTTWHDRKAGESKFKFREWLPSYMHWYMYALRPRNPKA